MLKLMFSIKDKYILSYICIIWLYLVFRMNHMASYYADYDSILVAFIVFGGWFILCSHRTFTLTRKKLSTYYFESVLDYKPLIKDNIIEKVFVRVNGSDDWYELDYILTIPKYCQSSVFYSFVNKNRSVRDLLTTMNKMADDAIIGKEYKLMKVEYSSIKWLSLSLILIVYLIIGMATYSNSLTY